MFAYQIYNLKVISLNINPVGTFVITMFSVYRLVINYSWFYRLFIKYYL